MLFVFISSFPVVCLLLFTWKAVEKMGQSIAEPPTKLKEHNTLPQCSSRYEEKQNQLFPKGAVISVLLDSWSGVQTRSQSNL